MVEKKPKFCSSAITLAVNFLRLVLICIFLVNVSCHGKCLLLQMSVAMVIEVAMITPETLPN